MNEDPGEVPEPQQIAMLLQLLRREVADLKATVDAGVAEAIRRGLADSGAEAADKLLQRLDASMLHLETAIAEQGADLSVEVDRRFSQLSTIADQSTVASLREREQRLADLMSRAERLSRQRGIAKSMVEKQQAMLEEAHAAIVHWYEEQQASKAKLSNHSLAGRVRRWLKPPSIQAIEPPRSLGPLLARLEGNMILLGGVLESAVEHQVSTEAVQARVRAMFQRFVEGRGETVLRPYAKITEYGWFGFEEPAEAQLIESPRDRDLVSSDGFRNRLEIRLDNPANTKWFSLEFAIPWDAVLNASTMSLVANMESEVRIPIRVNLFAWNLAQEKCVLGASAFKTDVRNVKIETDIRLSDGTEYDVNREPVLCLFFKPEEFTVKLDGLWVRFA